MPKLWFGKLNRAVSTATENAFRSYFLANVVVESSLDDRIFVEYVDFQLGSEENLDFAIDGLRPRVNKLAGLALSLSFLRGLCLK